MRLISIPIIFFCASLNIYAQKPLPVPMQKFLCSARLEVVGGPNFNKTDINAENSDSYKSRVGINAGIQIHTKLSENVTFTPGFKIDQKGNTFEYEYSNEYEYEYEVPSNDGVNTNQLSLKAAPSFDGIQHKTLHTYFSIPLVFGITPFPKARSVQFSAGVNPAFLLGSRTKTNSFGNITGTFGKEGIKKFDFGFLVGANYTFENGLSLGVMYDHSLTNTVDIENSTTESYNRSVKLQIAYRINFNPLFIESYTSKRKNLRFN